MAASIVSSIIFFLLFIILSLSVDVRVFAAQMEHRKLGGAKETMTMRRNLEENGGPSPTKIAAGRSISTHAGSKTAKNEPSQTQPDPASAQGQRRYVSYKALQKSPACNSSCAKPKPASSCSYFGRCKNHL